MFPLASESKLQSHNHWSHCGRFAEFLVVKLDGCPDHIMRLLSPLELKHFHSFLLQLLVVLEEAVHLIEQMLWQFADIVDVAH